MLETKGRFYDTNFTGLVLQLSRINCLQIIIVEMRSENRPNLNRKFVIRASKVVHRRIFRRSSFPPGFRDTHVGAWSWPAANLPGQTHLGLHRELPCNAGLASHNQGKELILICIISQIFNIVEAAFLSLQGFFVSLIFCYLNRWVVKTARVQWVCQTYMKIYQLREGYQKKY